jgi:hypothetical protein
MRFTQTLFLGAVTRIDMLNTALQTVAALESNSIQKHF